jgi:alkylation response protein AidB-like acyl-CoA dehydrogenase
VGVRFLASEEQMILRESVDRWVRELDPRRPSPPSATWRHLVEMGWLAAGLPETCGGLGGDAYDLAIIAEQLGRGLVRAPFVDAVTTSAEVLMAVEPGALPALVLGEHLTLIAHDEPGSRGDLGWCSTRAAHGADGWRLCGRKSAVLGAPDADRIVCTAIVEEAGMSFFELEAPSRSMRAYTTIDDRRSADLYLDRASARLVGPLGGALPVMKRARDASLVIESAEALGAMQRAFELTREHLLTRRQYGQRIGDFQALRHLIADMFIELEQARSMVLRGVDALGGDDARLRGALAAATKARVVQAGLHVTAQAIQLHGGVGMTEEYPVGHFFKRLLAFNLRHGAADAHLARYYALTHG